VRGGNHERPTLTPTLSLTERERTVAPYCRSI
jgi:hypothetical protein